METNSFKEISLSFVRDRVKDRLSEFSSTMRDDSIDLAIMDANRDILSKKKLTQKTEYLTLVDFKCPLPCDFDSLIAIVPMPFGETDVPQQLVYSDYAFDGLTPNTIVMGLENRFKIMDGYFRFPTDTLFDEFAIFYNAYKTDSEGFPLLPDSHVMYYVEYCMCRMFEIKGDYKQASYFKSNYLKRRKALIHNEQAVDYELNKEALRLTILSVFPKILYGFNNRNYGGSTS